MKEVFEFLENLRGNNNREWFQSHKDQYEQAHQAVIGFTGDLITEINKHDNIEATSPKKALFRIYRDVRFAKDKTPYKTSWNGRFQRATNQLRGGYYFHLESEQTYIAGGFWQPNSQDILHIRKQIQQDSQPLRKITANKRFKDYFGELIGEKVKSAPQGFSKEDPDIDLLRHKGFILSHTFTDQEIFDPNFAKTMSDGFKQMRPFLDYMTDILTTDLNGLPLV